MTPAALITPPGKEGGVGMRWLRREGGRERRSREVERHRHDGGGEKRVKE